MWSRAGGFPALDANGNFVPGDFLLVGKAGMFPLTQFKLGAAWTYDDANVATGLALSENIPLGVYELASRGIYLTVTAPPAARQIIDVQPSGDNDDQAIQSVLNAGNSVRLAPGCYEFEKSVFVQGDGVEILGVGEDQVRLHFTNDEQPVNAFFRCWPNAATNFSLSGMTFDARDVPGAITVSCDGTGTPGDCINFEFSRCRLIEATGPDLILGSGAHVYDIEAMKSSLIQRDHSLYQDIDLRGVCDFSNEYLVYGDQVAVVNLSFDRTGRGPILRGPCTNGLYHTIRMDGIDVIPNGSEGFGVEGLGFNDNLVLHLFYRGNGDGIEIWNTPVANNLFRHFQIDGGRGILFGVDEGVTPPAWTGNVFQDGELQGGWIDFGGAAGNDLVGVAIVKPRPTRGNEPFWSAAAYATVQPPILNDGGNSQMDVTVIR